MSEAITPISTPLDAWLEAAGAKHPTPGGGSVAALVGALAAAMGEMTLNYSVNRPSNTADVDAALAPLLAEMSRARSLLLQLCEEDQIAYSGWRAAKKAGEASLLKEATAASIAVPQAIMATSLIVLDLAVRAVAHANPWLLSDLLVCGDLATAAVRCGSYNIEANLTDFNKDEAATMRAECAAQVNRAVERVTKLAEHVAKVRGQ